MLVIPELPIEERNYPLLLFSRGKKRKAFLKELARKGAIEYLRLAYELYPQDVLEVFDMSKDYPTLEENIKFIVKHLGTDKLLGAMQPEEIAQALPAEQGESLLRSLLRHIRPQEIAQAISAEQEDALLRALLLKRLSPEEVDSVLRNDGKRRD